MSNYTLPDCVEITVPEVIDVAKRRIDAFDYVEGSLWDIFKEFCDVLGITIKGVETDWATVKQIEEKMFEILEEAGVEFNY